MYCIQCGTTLPGGTKFCPECGAPQPAVPPQPQQGYAAPVPQPVPQPQYGSSQQTYDLPQVYEDASGSYRLRVCARDHAKWSGTFCTLTETGEIADKAEYDLTLFSNVGAVFVSVNGVEHYGQLRLDGDRLVLTIDSGGDSWRRVTDLILLPVSE